MNSGALFPRHILRREEEQIRQVAARVSEERSSRAVLLYGSGGVGKTSLVRELARRGALDAMTVWIDPIDVDDSEYWLLSNLERTVAKQLDPDREYFSSYFDYLSRLPSYTRPRIGHETVVSHLGRIKRVFIDCYRDFTERSGKTVVIVFDTIEAVRGMYLVLTLTQWMKALPATLFILAGREMPGHERDPVYNELQDPHQPIPVTTIRLGDFTEEAALDYLDHSSVAAGLTAEEKTKLVRLTRGHPLWLAFTIAYLDEKGIPEEAEVSLEDIEQHLPYQGAGISPEGQRLHDAFKRRLVTPYRETDFWHEADKRLAAVRQSMNRSIWKRLMSDRPLPRDLPDLDAAWDQLLRRPWIRPRANQRFVTLHDAVAEELARRIIPLHDQDKQWRRQLWSRAVEIYGEYLDGPEATLAERMAALDDRLERLEPTSPAELQERPTADRSALIRAVAELDAEKRELDQLKAARLYYQLLCGFEEGCRHFLQLFEEAKRDHDVLFQDLLALVIQRFLPSGVHSSALDDVVGEAISSFQDWLYSSQSAIHLDIGLAVAGYMIDNDQPRMAVQLLKDLPENRAAPIQLYRSSLMRGNAYMRIPGRMQDASGYFLSALQSVEDADVSSADRLKLVAEAQKELGYYYRNEGLWDKAEESYGLARDAILAALNLRDSDEDREELASVLTNWAYVMGLNGNYREGANLVESAIAMRQRLNKRQEEGISWSVCGEVYRYERRFEMAWAAYSRAERIFQESRNWSWLGSVYQEQAICLFQASQDGIDLTPDRDTEEYARRLIVLALDICRDRAVRGYPSALNRAGRILGKDDHEKALYHLNEGIEQAQRLSDGRFWFTNLIEYVELCYRLWSQTEDPYYRDQITARAGEIQERVEEHEFADLEGRWRIVRAHLAVHEGLATRNDALLNDALEDYQYGFALLARGFAGSSGAAIIPDEFRVFGGLLQKLPADVRATWRRQLTQVWGGLESGSTVLLARLQELY